VVVVAIWGERIRQIWVKPKLRIRLDDPSFTTTSGGQRGWYYLLRVTNEKESSPARNVRVLLTRVLKRGPDGSWQEQRFSGHTQVNWRWTQLMPLYATIGPDELSTFGQLLEGSDSFELQLYWYPNNLTPTIPSNEPTRLQFKAVSDTVASDTLTVEVAWDGDWVEGRLEMQNHLVVREITR
jgi:hypothetical protein